MDNIKRPRLFAGVLVGGVLLLVSSCASTGPQTMPRVIAHRGFWRAQESVHNSLSSLEHAIRIGAWGSETDILITRDGVAVISHDPALWGQVIEDSTWEDIKQVRLPNGESLPTLESFLQTLKAEGGETNLVIEVTPHREEKNDERVVAEILRLVREYGLEDRVIYVSFSLDILKRIARDGPPGSLVLYLGSNMTPGKLARNGISGFNYLVEEVMLFPSLIRSAKRRGLFTAVWTVNTPEKMQWCIDQGIDFITTDDPLLLMSLIEKARQVGEKPGEGRNE